ncbi:LCP family protein [Hathewaya limosa]|uniref:LCP family protein required for cell wall assembly n=1 Tax=Hathewaya limosa TaxID=1536 RepID=A0ABU0JTW7_HATLI|nr:LCP family protein [Hathewaya limosa]MDQ0480546.1 LCP family protein required for cell wall assembly [Hathewaya limosa]
MRKRKKSSAKKKALLAILSLLIILLLVVTSGLVYFWSKLNSIKKQPLTKVETTKESEKKAKQHNEVVNIALFGLDSRDVHGNDDPRSDSIMILSIDKDRNSLRLSSIIRDTYVQIPKRSGKDKINHAYHFGGPELAISTINKNFGLAIKDFASINFYGLRKVIDTIGGIELDITSEELKYINNYIRDAARDEKITPTYVDEPGKQKLNGLQATAYCRIRYTKGGDFKRAERQRTVLTKIINKVKTINKTKYPALLDAILPNVKTSLSSTKILDLGMEILSMDISNIQQQQFPTDWTGEGKTINGYYYYIPKLEKVKEELQAYVYENKKPKKPIESSSETNLDDNDGKRNNTDSEN